MSKWITLICPHCRRESRFLINSDQKRYIVNCSIDDGGCDKDYIVDITITVEKKYFLLKEV